jgi:hypothetical protein
MLLIPSFLLDNGLNNEERSWEPLIFHNVVRLSISLPPDPSACHGPSIHRHPLQPLRPKQRANSMPRSQTLSRELEIKLQGSGNLERAAGHKRSCSIDERKKKDKASTADLLSELKEGANRKKEKKRGESFNNRSVTLRPPTSSSAASSLLSPREKAHKRTRSSADDLTKVSGVRERVKESLRTFSFCLLALLAFM